MDVYFADENVLATKSVTAEGPEAEVVFENVPYGYYAAVVLHDENGNNQLDYTGMYIPLEATGITNGMDKYINGGIPEFEHGKFLLEKEKFEMSIEMYYK